MLSAQSRLLKSRFHKGLRTSPRTSLMWSREGPGDVLMCVTSLCPYRGKRASWEQNGFIRSENQSGNVCKENTQALWSRNPVSAQRPILTGELVLVFRGVLDQWIQSTVASWKLWSEMIVTSVELSDKPHIFMKLPLETSRRTSYIQVCMEKPGISLD